MCGICDRNFGKRMGAGNELVRKQFTFDSYQIHKILRELIGKDILMVEEDADIFMEYFRNQKNFLKFIGY